MRTPRLVPAFGLFVCAQVAAPALATTVSMTASKDNTLFEANPSQPGGPIPDLSSGLGQLFAGGIAQQNSSGTAIRRRALFAFPILANIPAGATITGATLTLRATKGFVNQPYLFDVRKVLGDWGEGTSNSSAMGGGQGAAPSATDVTWNYRFFGTSSAWVTPGGDFSSLISASAGVPSTGSVSWSGAGLIADVQSWVNDPASNFGWGLMADFEAQTSTARRFASREDANAANRPTLVVTYTVPSPASLVPLAAFGLLWRRRR